MSGTVFDLGNPTTAGLNWKLHSAHIEFMDGHEVIAQHKS
jgi:hypothetical protein